MKKLACVVAILLITIFTFGCKEKMTKEEIAGIIGTDKLETEYYTASFVIDTDDLSNVTTYAKYVFVGTIEDYVKTEYSSEDENEIYTYYSVKVLENIKGELIQDENIELKKAGGISKDQEHFLLCYGDTLPAVGETYVFAAVMFEYDGSIYCYGPNTVGLIKDVDNYKEDKTYLSYIEALKTTSIDVPEREWSMSRYDVQYEK